MLQIERQAFENTINRLNAYFAEAEKASCSTYCEGCLACMTAYLIYICKETHYEKVSFPFLNVLFVMGPIFFQCLKKVAKFVADQNEKVYQPRGLVLTDPTMRGLRVIEISCLDRPPNAWLTLSHSTQEFFM